MQQCLSPYRSQKGYILILNIGVLALLLLGATYMGRQIELALSMGRAELAGLDQEEQIADARARVFFLLSTSPRTMYGLAVGDETVIPDGRLYRVDEHVAVSLQDIRGLLSVNGIGDAGSGRAMLERLLGTYGLDSDTAARLTDALLDYRDSDSLRRLNGAEEEDYQAIGVQQQPRNANLRLPQELARVYGWSDVKALWGEDPITDHISVHERPIINPNTADWRVLSALAGAAPDTVKSLVASRAKGAIKDITPLVAPGLSGDPFAGGPLIVKTPSDELLVTFIPKEGKRGIRYDVVHTPESEHAPWRIQYSEKIVAKNDLTGWEEIPLLPSHDPSKSSETSNQVQLPF